MKTILNGKLSEFARKINQSITRKILCLIVMSIGASFLVSLFVIKKDHIHMLVSIPPKMSVSSFMGYLKGKSALMIFDRHANLKYKFGNRHFWSEGYYVSTVGLNEATIKKYIQDQENYDIMQDKLSVKEYEDPFKGTESK